MLNGRDIFVMERARTQSQKFYFRREQAGMAFQNFFFLASI
jgi:hypothetical protein